MIKAFSVGDPLLALNLRSRVVLERLTAMLDREFPGAAEDHRRFVAAERNIAGELYNSFFFRATLERQPGFSAVCDERLLSIYSRNFPEVEFIPKTPRLRLARQP